MPRGYRRAARGSSSNRHDPVLTPWYSVRSPAPPGNSFRIQVALGWQCASLAFWAGRLAGLQSGAGVRMNPGVDLLRIEDVGISFAIIGGPLHAVRRASLR